MSVDGSINTLFRSIRHRSGIIDINNVVQGNLADATVREKRNMAESRRQREIAGRIPHDIGLNGQFAVNRFRLCDAQQSLNSR